MARSMSNIEKVRHYQHHIDRIISETRTLFDRLVAVIVPTTINNLIDQQPKLHTTAEIVRNKVAPITYPILGDVASTENVQQKDKELTAFKDDVIELFTRLQSILQWKFVMEICGLGGAETILIPQQQLQLIDIYCEYRESLGPSSPSSEDSCNIGATFY